MLCLWMRWGWVSSGERCLVMRICVQIAPLCLRRERERRRRGGRRKRRRGSRGLPLAMGTNMDTDMYMGTMLMGIHTTNMLTDTDTTTMLTDMDMTTIMARVLSKLPQEQRSNSSLLWALHPLDLPWLPICLECTCLAR